MTKYVLAVDAKRLEVEQLERIAEIEADLLARILVRIRAGEDPRMAATEEVHRALAQLDAASATFNRALDALPAFPKPRR